MIYRRGNRYVILLTALFGLLSNVIYAQNKVHVVVKGDTIFSISRSYGVSQEDLMRQNGISDPSKLLVGMRLSIPSGAGDLPAVAAAVPVTASPGGTYAGAYAEYTVAANDTLYSIARTRGVTLQALRDINGFSRDYVLKAGEKIKIPNPAAAANSTVQSAIARPPLKPIDPSIRWPVTAKEILYMSGNKGVLVTGEISESVKSLTRGTVVYASPWRGYGNVAVVESGSYRYLYGACGTLSVRKGDSVEPGAELGKLGIYPASGKPDLVLIVSHDGSPVDPVRAPRF